MMANGTAPETIESRVHRAGWLSGFGAMALILASDVAATTWNVYEDHSGDARTIQAAMELAAYGDTVLVWPGRYEDPITIPSGVTLLGQAGPSQTILDANRETSLIDAGWQEWTSGIVVQGFTLTGTLNDEELSRVARTIHVWGSAVVRDCEITGNFAMVAGAHLQDGDLRIYDCRFFGNIGGWELPWVSGVSCGGGYLVVQRCTFEDQVWGATFRSDGGIIEFRDNVVRNSPAFEITPGTESVLIFNSLFDGVPHPVAVDGTAAVIIRQNTFVRVGSSGAALGPALGTNTIVDRNVFSGAWRGLWLCCPGVTVTCNDSWGNDTNWFGPGEYEGVDGNASLPPKFCDAVAGDFTVAENSPLLPANSPCNDQIGAFGRGCGPAPVREASWTSIKARFR